MDFADEEGFDHYDGAKTLGRMMGMDIYGGEIMVDILDEIGFLKNVLIAMREGASDEKRMMMDAIEIVSY